jgi:hypothetical protein
MSCLQRVVILSLRGHHQPPLLLPSHYDIARASLGPCAELDRRTQQIPPRPRVFTSLLSPPVLLRVLSFPTQLPVAAPPSSPPLPLVAYAQPTSFATRSTPWHHSHGRSLYIRIAEATIYTRFFCGDRRKCNHISSRTKSSTGLIAQTDGGTARLAAQHSGTGASPDLTGVVSR